MLPSKSAIVVAVFVGVLCLYATILLWPRKAAPARKYRPAYMYTWKRVSSETQAYHENDSIIVETVGLIFSDCCHLIS